MQNLPTGPQFTIQAVSGGFYILMDGVLQHRWTSLEVAQRRVAHMQKWYSAEAAKAKN